MVILALKFQAHAFQKTRELQRVRLLDVGYELLGSVVCVSAKLGVKLRCLLG